MKENLSLRIFLICFHVFEFLESIADFGSDAMELRIQFLD